MPAICADLVGKHQRDRLAEALVRATTENLDKAGKELITSFARIGAASGMKPLERFMSTTLQDSRLIRPLFSRCNKLERELALPKFDALTHDPVPPLTDGIDSGYQAPPLSSARSTMACVYALHGAPTSRWNWSKGV